MQLMMAQAPTSHRHSNDICSAPPVATSMFALETQSSILLSSRMK